MNDVLLTVSGTIPENLDAELAALKRPEPDYRAMARGFGADLLDYPRALEATGQVGKLLRAALGNNFMLAWACFLLRRKYRVLFTDGEQVGLPLALLLKYLDRTRTSAHVMIVHVLSVPKKRILIDRLSLYTHVDRFLVYSSWQKSFIEKTWSLPPARVPFTPFMVDSRFFTPEAKASTEVAGWLQTLKPPIICAVGLEFRDYPTLLAAVDGLDVRVVIAAASPWSKRQDTTQDQRIPENVSVRKFTQMELRDVYAASSFLVMPLYDVTFQAGVTAILEAMAMAIAVVCTRTPGQTDVIEEGVTGLYVPPSDPDALRRTIQRLLSNPDESARMGRAGRRVIDDTMSLERYVARLGGVVAEVKSSY